MQTFTKVGLDALLTPENCAVLLLYHQPSQLANVNSHEPTIVINNVTALAKAAKAYGVPTILTTINTKRGGEIFKQVQAVFPDQKPIDRTFINSWEDRRVVKAVKKTGRKKLVMAALGRRCVLHSQRSMRWATATTSMWLPTLRAASLRKHMTWQSAASSPRGPNRSHGLAWLGNFSAIGRALRGSEKLLRSCSIMPALPSPYLLGNSTTKQSTRRAWTNRGG